MTNSEHGGPKSKVKVGVHEYVEGMCLSKKKHRNIFEEKKKKPYINYNRKEIGVLLLRHTQYPSKLPNDMLTTETMVYCLLVEICMNKIH